jgi:hypothetical protein
LTGAETATETPSTLSKYLTRSALTYYALALPAIIAQLIFSISLASNSGSLVPQVASLGGTVSATILLLPWLFLIVSAYAVFSFRPSTLVTMLAFSFLIVATATSSASFLGAQLDLADLVLLVIAASFLALAGFNYARGAKLLAGRRLDVRSAGPRPYQAMGIGLEIGTPLLAVFVLVALVQAVVGAVNVQAALLPQPLSTLASLYLQSRFGIVFATLFVAGATIWVLRQLLEPALLYFTLTAADAKKELLGEIEPTTKSVKKIARYRPSGGLAWGLLAVVYCGGLIAALALFLPRDQLLRDLLAPLSLKPPPHTSVEVLIQSSIQSGLVRVDIAFAQSQDYIRTIIRLLWG